MVHSGQKRLRFIALMLSATLAFQSVGWLVAWKGMQLAARLEAQGVLSQAGNSPESFASINSPLHRQTFSKNFLQSIKVDGKKEIVLDGRLYDYRMLAESGDSIQVLLYHDHHEQALLKALGQAFQSTHKENAPSNAPVVLWLAKWLGSAFLLPEKPVVASGIAPPHQKQVFSAFLLVAQSAPGVFAPPPEV
jgi:hypothetical protein